MSLRDIQSAAEDQADQIVQTLQDQVILLTAKNSGELSSVQLDVLRNRGISLIEDHFQNVSNNFTTYFNDAFNAGKLAANKAMKGESSFAFHQLQDFLNITQNSFDQLSAQLKNEFSTLVGRVKLGSVSESEMLRKLSSSLFKGVEAKARGIANGEVEIIFNHAYNNALKDLSASMSLKARMGTIKNPKNVAVKTEPVTIEVWRHSHGGNPPRWNHVDMHSKGVVSGYSFQLTNRDDDGVYYTYGPHAPDLPAEEVIHCHCSKVARIIWVTPDEKKKLIERSQATGGFLDSRWRIN